MSDPYKVLNISPNASDDDVKHAYRELARKYHPDNYLNNPLADLAQEKMKEINEAYDQIQKQRKSGSAYQSAQSASGGYHYGYSTSGSDPLMDRIRMAINRGDITQAERLLGEVPAHNAQWHFLMGIVCSRRGWMDDARRYLKTACDMDPTNEEYRSALNMFAANQSYRPVGYRQTGTMTYDNNECMRLCTALSCCALSGGRCLIC